MAEPPITLRATFSDTARGGNLPVTRVVIHATAGGQGYPKESRAGVAHATAQYFAGGSAGGSAHYITDASGDEEHCVPDDVVAYHAPPNKGSIGIEICADPSYTREQWLSPQVWPAVQAAARRARELLDRYGLPLNRLLPADLLAGQHGVCAHVDVSNAWKQSTHWDTGPNFPWPEFMAEVNGPSSPSPSPASPQEDDMFDAPDRAQLAELLSRVQALTSFAGKDAAGNNTFGLAPQIQQTAEILAAPLHSRVEGSTFEAPPRDFWALVDAATYRTEQQVAGLTAAVNALADKVGSEHGASAEELKAAVTEAMQQVVQVRVSVEGQSA